MNTVKGKIHVFGNNIDTDQICPGVYLELTDPHMIASHCLEGADPDFSKKCETGDIVVAGTNFGCGSSREHAAIALKHAGVSAVVAKSFARIFYRNAINLGILLVVCDQADAFAEEGSMLEILPEESRIVKCASGEAYACEPVSDYMKKILEAGGIKNLMRGV